MQQMCMQLLTHAAQRYSHSLLNADPSTPDCYRLLLQIDHYTIYFCKTDNTELRLDLPCTNGIFAGSSFALAQAPLLWQGTPQHTGSTTCAW